MRKKPEFFINVIIPIIIGTTVYLALKPDAVVSKLVLSVFGVEKASLGGMDFHPFLRVIITGYLSDIMWAYALTYSLALIFGTNKHSIIHTAIISILFEVMIECLQINQTIHGTFDVVDIIAESITSTVALSVFIVNKRKITQQKRRSL